MARTLFNSLLIAVLFSAFISSTYSISPLDLSHIPSEPFCFTPLAGSEASKPAASYIYDAASFFHPNPQRIVVPQQISSQIAQNPLIAAMMPYAQQYMSHRTRSTQNKGVGAELGDGTSNTTVHAWFIIFLVILGGLAWTAHHTVKSAEAEERKEKEKKLAEERHKRSLIVGPVEEIQLPIDEDVHIYREGQNENVEEGEGNARYVNPNYYSVHENQENGYAQQQDPSYYENQEPTPQYNQGGDDYERIQGSSTYHPEGEVHHQGYQQNGQYYDDRQALDQYGASQGPSDYEGQGQAQYGNYQYEDDQDLANLVDDEK